MKNKKGITVIQLIIIIFTVSLLAAILIPTLLAYGKKIYNDDYGLAYHVIGNEIYICEIFSEGKDLTIPSIIDNYEVSTIQASAIKNDYIEKIYIDANISLFGGSISSCSNLKEIYINGNITLNPNCISNCPNLSYIEFNSCYLEFSYDKKGIL